MIYLGLALCFVLPAALLVAWFVVLAYRVPGPVFFAVGAALTLAAWLLGDADRAAARSNLPPDCQSGVKGGMQCGLNLDGIVEHVNAASAALLLVILAGVTIAVRKVRPAP